MVMVSLPHADRDMEEMIAAELLEMEGQLRDQEEKLMSQLVPR
jgi:protein subunit release factor A